jgi:hypothetical protein
MAERCECDAGRLNKSDWQDRLDRRILLSSLNLDAVKLCASVKLGL